MKRYAILSSLMLTMTAGSFAHPGIGIVADSRGIIYYTDLKHVWKLLPDGTKHIAVRNVHTHELYLDAEDNLYGEHLWYEGEATDKWGHRIWRLGSDGKLEDIIPSRSGFRDDYDDFHFVRDSHGSMYWVDRDENAVRMRSPGGPARTIARSRFQNVRWMTVSPGGTLYLMDLFDLVTVKPDGSIRIVARDIADNQRSLIVFRNEHAVMGIAADSAENVFAAIASDRVVRRITAAGQVSVIYRSPEAWVPTGVCVVPGGGLLVLEYDGNNEARAVRIPLTD